MTTGEPGGLIDIPGNDETQLGNKGEIPQDPIHFHQRLAETQKILQHDGKIERSKNQEDYSSRYPIITVPFFSPASAMLVES